MLHDLSIPIWAIVVLLIVTVIPTYVLFFTAARRKAASKRPGPLISWSRWKELSQKAADVQARVFLTIFYFTLMAPFGRSSD